MDTVANEASLAVFQFIELLSIISFLSIAFIILLLLFINSTEKKKRLEEQSKEERLLFETITQVQESERNRISHDLHDTVTQDIRTALLFVHKIQNSKDFALLTEEQKALLDKVHQIEDQNLKNIRSIIRNLTPPEIESATIVQLISEFCTNVSDSAGIPCKFYAEKSDLYQKLTEEEKLHIFRIVQESVNNAVKHSGASEISVIVREDSENAVNESEKSKSTKKSLVFLISDDGSGFAENSVGNLMGDGHKAQEDSAAHSEQNLERGGSEQLLSASGTHLGLRGMKSRATLLGAELHIKSDAESGTQIKLVIGL